MKLIWTAVFTALAAAGLAKHRQVCRARPELRVAAAYSPNPLSDRSLPLIKAGLARLPQAEDASRTQVSVPSPDGPVTAFTYAPASGEPHSALLWIHGGGRVSPPSSRSARTTRGSRWTCSCSSTRCSTTAP
ncbi:hypothetical protein [Serinicoccus sp. CUA-874]|uniref:hypothetical protein n=1 Tax=Serinicoccus sp. CUA-874 TaxID=1517939 RepID=UPI001EDC83D4|nr:hypothetical protein [Serinicoccus sp. CUA-874]